MLSKLRKFINVTRFRLRSALARRQILRNSSLEDQREITRADWLESVKDPTAFYNRCFRYFHSRLPKALRDHHRYFSEEQRGFGEDAFHTMWFSIFREHKPERVLEIGVYRGQTLTLFSLLSRLNSQHCDICGISPFEGVGGGAYKYLQNLDYLADVQSNFRHFSLPLPTLLKTYSTDPAAHELIGSKQWDLIYIDGCHDYEIAKADWEICSANMKIGGLVVLDDAGVRTGFNPPVFATKGFPDVSRLAEEIDRERFRPVLQVGHNIAFQRVR